MAPVTYEPNHDHMADFKVSYLGHELAIRSFSIDCSDEWTLGTITIEAYMPNLSSKPQPTKRTIERIWENKSKTAALDCVVLENPTPADREKVERYLADKFGVEYPSCPTDSPVITEIKSQRLLGGDVCKKL